MESANKDLVYQYIEKVINTGNIDLIPHFIAHNYVEEFEGKYYPMGIEGAKEHLFGIRKTYPDLTLKINRQIAEGPWVATCYTMSGTHVGEWMGIAPTHKLMVVTGVNIDKVVDGKIVEHGGAANLFTSLLGIGAIQVISPK